MLSWTLYTTEFLFTTARRTARVFLSSLAYLKVILIPALRKRYINLNYYETAAGRPAKNIFFTIVHYELRGRLRNIEMSPNFKTDDYLKENEPIFILRPCSPFVEFILRGKRLYSSQSKLAYFLSQVAEAQTTTPATSQTNSQKNIKVAFYSAVIEAYDAPQSINLEEVQKQFPALQIDSFLYTDSFFEEVSGRSQKFTPFYCHDPKRTSGWLKTHPHILFPNYDYVIWMDGNLKVSPQGLTKFIKQVTTMRAPISSYPHPERNNVLDEAMSVINCNRDNAIEVTQQIIRYNLIDKLNRLGPLLETRVFLWNMKHPAAIPLAKSWWRELSNGCKRDQISLPWVLKELNISPELIEGPDTPPRKSKLIEILRHREFLK